MSLFAKLIYQALVWKERQRTARSRVAESSHAKRERLQAKGKPPKPLSSSRVHQLAAHLETGKRGENLAYWYLRQAGYTIVARNRPSESRAGELDLVAWDGPVLAFIEVKTRTSLEAGQPEAAISSKKQKRVARTAQEYMRKMARKGVQYRFDTVSVLWDSQAGYHVRLTKDAFKA